MKKVEIPFNKWSRERIALEEKEATTRRKKYGDIGDYFYLCGKRYFLTEVYKTHLEFVAKNLFPEEGAKNEDEFIEIWNSIHPRKRYNPTDWVWFHRFEVMK